MSASNPLGRGLGSLIPLQTKTPSTKEDPTREIHRLPLGKVRPNPRQPRTTMVHSDLEELIESVREHGILQPLVVTPKNQDYEIIAGERRFQAAKIVGLKTLPVIIRDVDEQEQLELALVENLQRQDLNPLEEAEAYQRLVDEFNMTQEQVAKRVGKSRSYVANTLRLRTLPDEVKKAILDKKITEGHAKVLLSMETPKEQLDFLHAMLQQKFTVRASEAYVASKRGTKPLASLKNVDPNLQAQEEALQRILGTKVTLKRTGKGGSITIEFYSTEEMSALIEQLTNARL